MPIFKNIIDNETVIKNNKKDAIEYFKGNHPDIQFYHVKMQVAIEYIDEQPIIEDDIEIIVYDEQVTSKPKTKKSKPKYTTK